jgi:two-component system, LytTR family, response regulator
MIGRPHPALVVEDEPIARDAVVRMLAAVPWLRLCGVGTTGTDGLSLAISERPVIVLLDIQMPGMSGIELAQRLPFEAVVIFTTAHDAHALSAFELGAIDYVRKPFSAERLHRALERARPMADAVAHRRSSSSAGDPAPVTALVERHAEVTSNTGPLTRLFVREQGQIIPVRVTDLVRCEGDGDYVRLHTADGRSHLLYITLTELASRLDGARFVRVHRSHLLNLDRVTALVPYDATRLEVRLGNHRIVASRAGTLRLRELTQSRGST